jgi:hypothetical protein
MIPLPQRLHQRRHSLHLTPVQRSAAAIAAAAAVGSTATQPLLLLLLLLLLEAAAEVCCCCPHQGSEAGVLAAGGDLQATFHGCDG